MHHKSKTAVLLDELTKKVLFMEKYSIMRDMGEDKPKLLVVDDELDQCDSIKNYFSKRNFTVFTASNGQDALSSIKENKPDMVLLDGKLKGEMEGKDVLHVIRQTDKRTKVAMITGDVLTEQEMLEVVGLGIVDFLHKPVDMQTLEKVVKKALKASYPKALHFEPIKAKEETGDASLRRIVHDLSNITSDIANKCELYILDEEEGLNKNKSEKERLDMAIEIIKSVLKTSGRFKELTRKLEALVKKGI